VGRLELRERGEDRPALVVPLAVEVPAASED
jgi:hypothetical protein